MGGNFAITRAGRNFELALDFLMFMTSYEQNILLNQSAVWLPAVRYVKLCPILEQFRHNIQGTPGIRSFFRRSGRTRIEFYRHLTTFLLEQGEDAATRQAKFEEFIDNLKDSYKRLAKRDDRESLRSILRNLEFLEYQVSWLDIIEEFFSDDKAKATDLAKKQKMVMESIIDNEINYNYFHWLFRETFK